MPAHALILVEGETELEFFTLLGQRYFRTYPRTFRNLRGNWNLNAKIIEKVLQFHRNHPGTKFFTCVCFDQERTNTPPFNAAYIRTELSTNGVSTAVIPIIAVLTVESLFFADIDGVYRHLRAPAAKRNPRKYAQFRKFTHIELAALFRQFGKQYIKGHRVESFVSKLDLEKISERCDELQLLIRTCST